MLLVQVIKVLLIKLHLVTSPGSGDDNLDVEVDEPPDETLMGLAEHRVTLLVEEKH